MEILRDEYYRNKLSRKIINEIMEGKTKKIFKVFKKNLNNNNFNKVKNILAILNDNDLRMTFKDRDFIPKI